MKVSLWSLLGSCTLLAILLAQPAQAAATHNVPIYSPESISNIAGRVYADTGGPSHQTKMTIGGATTSAVSQSITNWNLGAYTGVTSPAPLGNYQRGIDNAVPGSCAVQMTGTQLGVVLNTASSHNTLLNGQFGYSWNDGEIRPWAYTTSAFNMSFNAKIPTATVSGGACDYVGPSLLAYNSNGKGVWLGPMMFDTRWPTYGNSEGFGWDPGTNMGIAGGYFGAGSSRYSSNLPGSSNSTGTPWSDWRYYGFSISRAQFLNAINDLNTNYSVGLSTNPADYFLALMSIQNEIAWSPGTGGSAATAAMGLDNITAWTSGVPTPEPSAFALSVIGLAGMLAYAWRKRR